MGKRVKRDNFIKKAFSYLNIKKQVESSEDLKYIRSTQFWVRWTMYLFLIFGGAMSIGGIFCLATFDVALGTSITILVFGIIMVILGCGLVLILNNINARINSWKEKDEYEKAVG